MLTAIENSQAQTFSPYFLVDAPEQRTYYSAVTPQTTGFGKAAELFAAKECVIAGHGVPKPLVRDAPMDEIDGALKELDAVVAPFMEGLRRAGGKKGTLVERLTAIIRKASTQTTLTQFDSPEAMVLFRTRLEQSVARGEPIILAMPEGGGKAPVHIKTGAGIGPDFAEYLGLKMRAAVITALREVYKGGAHMINVPDAPLHTRDLGWTLEGVRRFDAHLWGDLPRLGIDNDEIIHAPTLNFLPSNWYDAVDQGAGDIRSRDDEGTQQKLESQFRSLLYIKRGPWKSDEEAVLAYAALSGDSSGIPDDVRDMAFDFERQVREVTPLYTAVNHHGIYGLDLIGRIVAGLGFSPNLYLRCSVHAKPGHPRLLLNIQNHRTPAGLLPMHSMGVRMEKDGKVRWGLTFEIVARMRGWHAVHEAETGRFMYYEAVE